MSEISGLHEVVDGYILSRNSRTMHRAKYFKVLDSVESDPVQPVDILSEEGTFRRRCLSRRTLLCVAVFIVLILAIVFIALFAHQISKKEASATAGNSKRATSTTEPVLSTTVLTPSSTTSPNAVCISASCVRAAAGQFILKFFNFFFLRINS